jgi:hypothetical protein
MLLSCSVACASTFFTFDESTGTSMSPLGSKRLVGRAET